MKQFLATLLHNVRIAADCRELTFSWNGAAEAPAPGQFITVRVLHATVPLLRRPFALSGFDPAAAAATCIVKTVGPASRMLAAKQPGEKLDIIGPLGNGFPDPSAGSRAILAGGGTGIGPLVFAAHRLLSGGGRPLTIFGARSSQYCPHTPSIQSLSPVVCTDDGSEGFRGTVVDYLASLPREKFSGAALFCCGPAAMLQGCHDTALRHGCPCLVSLEQTMACGVGACMGCAIQTVSGYARVCTDGPVFDSREIAWS